MSVPISKGLKKYGMTKELSIILPKVGTKRKRVVPTIQTLCYKMSPFQCTKYLCQCTKVDLCQCTSYVEANVSC